MEFSKQMASPALLHRKNTARSSIHNRSDPWSLFNSADFDIATMSHRPKGYFQFPPCLLAFGSDYKDRLQHIVSYCVCEHAQRLNRKLDLASPNIPAQTALCEAARFLNVNVTSHDATVERWKLATWWIEGWEERYGKDASVRIATILLWEAHNNTGVTYREFSILCAINSVIGDSSKPIRITERTIRIRAAGYKSWTVLKRELDRDKSRAARLLISNQVRYTLEQLHERRLFSRARVRAKTVKYMIGVTDDELRELLLQAETHRSRFRQERAQKDRELMIMIKSKNQTASHPSPPERQ